MASIRAESSLTELDLSLEFLMGRALDNAMLNVEQKDIATSKLLHYNRALALLTHLQRVLAISASAWRILYPRSMTQP
jgi:glucan phosphorylase